MGTRTISLDDEARADILAWLDNQKPMQDVIYKDEIQERIDRGREAIQALLDGADSLSRAQALDIVTFMHSTEPAQPLDPRSYDSPHSFCGQLNLLDIIEQSLRASGSDVTSGLAERMREEVGTLKCTLAVVNQLEDDSGSGDDRLSDVRLTLERSVRDLDGLTSKLVNKVES
jgi:hypothetical protein